MSTEPNITQRLTGASVLIALAVIFLPLILDGQKKNKVLDSQIPEKPISGEIILVNIGESTKEDIALSNSESDSNIVQEKGTSKELSTENLDSSATVTDTTIKQEAVKEVSVKSTRSQEKTTKAVVAAPKPVIKDISTDTTRQTRPNYQSSAFIIQIGSFGNTTNANNLVAKLKKAGYKAYLKTAQSNGKKISRVLVGPELKRPIAEAKIAKLNKISGLKAMVLIYDPIRH